MDILDLSDSYPYTRQVTDLIGAEGVTMFEDGKQQITSRSEEKIYIFSPKMPPDQLEEFCKNHLAEYEKIANENKDLINDCIDFDIVQFW